MSTSFYPLGMNVNNRIQGYKSWKAVVPVGLTSGTVRPLTNNDVTNTFPTGFGLPRPIKHARKGMGFNYNVLMPDPNNPSDYIEVSVNRTNKTQRSGTLVKQMIDTPGGYSVFDPSNAASNLDACKGICIVSTKTPTNVTENPVPYTQTTTWCCNAEKKARRRSMYASTNLKKNYYTTLQQYRENRCRTFEQRSFNFQSNKPVEAIQDYGAYYYYPYNPYSMYYKDSDVRFAKPGGPLSVFNTYFANCQPNGEIYDATENALVARLLYTLLTHDIITQEQYNGFSLSGNVTLQQLYDYFTTLPEENRLAALNAYLLFVSNPYYGVPVSGPSNPAGCKIVVYKPSNPQFAVQGAVSSSTRLLKLTVDTISTNAAMYNKKAADNLLNVNDITNGSNPADPFIYKNKSTACNYKQQSLNSKSCAKFRNFMEKVFTVPSAPTNVVITPGDTELVITFTPPPATDSDTPIVNYMYSINGGLTYIAFVPPTGPTSTVTITGLVNGTTYPVRLKAVNVIGEGPGSTVVNGTPSTIPSAPTGLSYTSGSDYADISFTPGFNGGSAITNYKYSIDDGASYTALSPADTSSPVTITGLTIGTTYLVKLLAVNANGDGTPSDTISVLIA